MRLDESQFKHSLHILVLYLHAENMLLRIIITQRNRGYASIDTNRYTMVIGIFVFGVTCLLLMFLSYFISFRVKPEHELIGINQTEYNLVGSNAGMLTQLPNLIKQGGSTEKIAVDKYSGLYQAKNNGRNRIEICEESEESIA